MTDRAGAARDIRLAGARGMIAERMMKSLSETAQVTFNADADVTALVRRRADWKAAGLTISLEDCVIAALAQSLARYPQLNAVVDGPQAVVSDAVHVAVAVAAHGMLMAPVISNADTLALSEISAQRRELVELVRNRKLPVSRAKGATTTVSNLGQSAVRYFTPILNAGQLTILGVGKTESVLALQADGTVAERLRMGLSLTVDHRFVDGEPAARMLTDFCELLQAIDANG